MAKLIGSRAELTALYYICNGKSHVQSKLLSKINKAHFFHTPCKNSYRRLMALLKTKGKVPYFETLCDDTTIPESDRGYLRAFEPTRHVKTIEDVEELFHSLENYRLLRAQWNLVERISEQINSEAMCPHQILEELEKEVSLMRVNTDVEECIYTLGSDSNIESLINHVLDQSVKDELVPTGFRAWDDSNGGVPLGTLMGVLGSTGAGKSLLASVQLLKNMCQYVPTCLVPLEMNEKQMTARLIANCSGIDVKNIIQRRLSEEELRRAKRGIAKFNERLDELDSSYNIFCPENDMTFDEIMYSLKPFGYKVILIDYISLLKGHDGNDQWRTLLAVSRHAKIWADRENIIIILLAQLSDEGKARYAPGVMENFELAWSFTATDTSREAGEINIKVTKARGFDPSPFTLGVDYSTMRVYDLDRIPEDIEERKEQLNEKKKPPRMDTRYEEEEEEQEMVRPKRKLALGNY